MGYAAPKVPMTAEEFLAWDEHETIKREFVRGEVFAMAGADEPHVTASPVQLASVQFTLSAERLWEDLDPPQVGDATLA